MNHVAPAKSVRRRGGRTSSTRAGTLTRRVPMKNLALAARECQHGGREPDGPMGHNAPVDLDAFRWLLTEPGQRLLARAAEASDDPLEASGQLRREARPEHVAVALTQVQLRRRAVPKF